MNNEDQEMVFFEEQLEDGAYSFIIQYDSIENRDELIDAISEVGGTVGLVIDYMNAVSATVTAEQLAHIRAMECVEYVEKNYDYNLLAEEEEDSTTEDYDQDEFSVYKGQDIKIALLDTGIAEHTEYAFSGGISFVDGVDDYTDTDGHGTKMAGIIKNIAPQSELYAVKLVESEGNDFVTTAAILMGIGWAIENGMNIINMSFGIYFESKLLKDAINLAYANNILLIAAVGNDGDFTDENRIMYPAAYEKVIAVGAGSSCGTETFSNVNRELDFVAPGRLSSTMLEHTYMDITGTSVSAAYVTGQLANLWSYDSTADNETVLNIARNAAAINDSQTNYVGYGIIDLQDSLQNYHIHVESTPIEKIFKNRHEVVEAMVLLEQTVQEQYEENTFEAIMFHTN